MSKEKKLTRWVERISAWALSALKMKNTIQVCLEPIGERFATLDNACEITDEKLYVNSDWLQQQRNNPDETEVRMLIYHEIRHLYQRLEVKNFREGKSTKEPLPVLLKWQYELTHYQRNEGGATTLRYYSQSIEIDAYAFAVYLLIMDLEKGERLSLDTRSIPDEIDSAVRQRAYEIAEQMSVNK